MTLLLILSQMENLNTGAVTNAAKGGGVKFLL